MAIRFIGIHLEISLFFSCVPTVFGTKFSSHFFRICSFQSIFKSEIVNAQLCPKKGGSNAGSDLRRRLHPPFFQSAFEILPDLKDEAGVSKLRLRDAFLGVITSRLAAGSLLAVFLYVFVVKKHVFLCDSAIE